MEHITTNLGVVGSNPARCAIHSRSNCGFANAAPKGAHVGAFRAHPHGEPRGQTHRTGKIPRLLAVGLRLRSRHPQLGGKLGVAQASLRRGRIRTLLSWRKNNRGKIQGRFSLTGPAPRPLQKYANVHRVFLPIPVHEAPELTGKNMRHNRGAFEKNREEDGVISLFFLHHRRMTKIQSDLFRESQCCHTKR